MLEKVKPVDSVQEWWEETIMAILRVGYDGSLQLGGDPQDIKIHGGGMTGCMK